MDKTVVFGEPSVKYRGLFMNDEAPGMTGYVIHPDMTLTVLAY